MRTSRKNVMYNSTGSTVAVIKSITYKRTECSGIKLCERNIVQCTVLVLLTVVSGTALLLLTGSKTGGSSTPST